MKAILITVDLETEQVNTAAFENDASDGGPKAHAMGLWEGIKEDWPTRKAVVVADDEANAIYADWFVVTHLQSAHKTESSDA